jgi:DNA-binding transcriptional LysR family regulator
VKSYYNILPVNPIEILYHLIYNISNTIIFINIITIYLYVKTNAKRSYLMDFRQLQYMLKVAEERSFSKAAQKLYIAQPSLSQYIQNLESQLGVQLFDRTTVPLRLTYAGELYIETAKKILDLQYQLSQQMEDIANLKKGRLTIGLSPFRSTYIMPKILPLFHERFPGIEVILLEGTSSELEELALKGSTDISIMTLPIEDKFFHYESVLIEEILVAVPSRHPFDEIAKFTPAGTNLHPAISLSELKDEPFIMLKQDQKLHLIAASLCKQAGFKPRIVLESESIEAAHALAAAGMGITFVPDTLTSFRTISQSPLYFSIADETPKREMVVAYRKGRYLSKAANEFIAIMKDILKH